MAVPVPLRARAFQTAFSELDEMVETPLKKYFPDRDAATFGSEISFEVLTATDERGRINSRSGRPNYETPTGRRQVIYDGKTWRDGIRIPAEELKDIRRVGASESQANVYISQQLAQLRRRYDAFREWLRASAIQGVVTFYPPGLDETYSELLLCSETCLNATVTTAWNAAAADEATARDNLEAIRADFDAARVALGGAKCKLDTAIMNTTTRGYIDAQAIAAGYDFLVQQIYENGGLREFADCEIEVNDETYDHPITGVETDYIPDNVVVFLDSNNTRSRRAMVHCEPVHVEAPKGARGVYFNSVEDEDGLEVRVSGEWTGGPLLGKSCAHYVLQDVTST